MSENKVGNNGLRDFVIITAGTLIVAAGIYFFKFPNHFSTGGVAGLAVVLPRIIPFSPGVITMALNLLFLLIGFLVFGKSFGIRTAYSSLLLSFSVFFLEKTVHLNAPLTDQPVLELAFAVLLPAIGSAILFNNRASTGGTDILAMIVKKFTGQEIGNALFMSDILISLSTFFVFDVKTGLFSVIGLLSKALVVNTVIESFNTVKYFTIITSEEEKVGEFIREVLHRGATRIDGKGIFTGEEKVVLLTVVRRSQAVILRDFVKKTDPHSFIMIANTSQIVGKGFTYAE